MIDTSTRDTLIAFFNLLTFLVTAWIAVKQGKVEKKIDTNTAITSEARDEAHMTAQNTDGHIRRLLGEAMKVHKAKTELKHARSLLGKAAPPKRPRRSK